MKTFSAITSRYFVLKQIDTLIANASPFLPSSDRARGMAINADRINATTSPIRRALYNDASDLSRVLHYEH
jgi:hypothetical protein